MANNGSKSNRWRFFRAGGFDQVKLESGADLLALDQLDLKLWVALACPTNGVEFDKTTLHFIDTDKDGRIRAPELLAAVRWVGSLLKNPDDLVTGAPSLRLSAVNDAQPEGKRLVQFAKQVLGKADSAEITVAEGEAAAQTFAAKAFNGDGIVPAESAPEAAVQTDIRDVISSVGSEVDASGKPGVSQAKVEQFFAEAAAYSDWWKQAEGNPEILPLGLNTPAAAAALGSVRSKITDFFTRCRLAAFDPRSLTALNREDKDFLAFGAKELNLQTPEIAGLPLARVAAGAPLPLLEGLNPAWAAAITNLRTQAVLPLLGEKTTLSEGEWDALQARLAPYEGWVKVKAGALVEKLGLARVRTLLDGKTKERLLVLVADDKAEAAHSEAVTDLNRLLHYHRDLAQLCHNFVSFRDFYGRQKKAIFQAGTLYLDQRSCDLCLTVEDPAKHAVLAGLGGTYLAYCDCVRKGTGEKMQIVAAFTGGDSDHLMVGRNGVFFDRKGRDWDATITKIIDNPISIRQAFFSPYKKLVRMIEEQVAKRAAAADSTVDARLAAAAKAVGETEPGKPPVPPKPKIDTGTLAAIGLVLATLTGAVGGIIGALLGLRWWQMPLAIVGVILAISGPAMLMAYLKLRRRNLGPILDANGWAVNARAKMNVPFGGALTKVAALPPGSQRDLVDPFAEKKSPWPLILLLLIVLGGVYYLLFVRGL